MRILHISSEDDCYGSAKCLTELLVEELKRNDVEPVVVTPYMTGINRFCDEHGIENYSCRYMSLFYYKHDKYAGIKFIVRKLEYSILKYLASHRIDRIIDFNSVDLIHTNNAGYDIGAVMSKKYKIPHILHLREGGLRHFNFVPYFRNSFAYMDARTTSYIAVSEFVKKEWGKLGFPPKKIKVFYDGISIDNISFDYGTTSKDKVKIAMSGSIDKAKGQRYLIEALDMLPELVKSLVEVHFYGGTEGEEYVYVKSLVEKYGLNEIVVFDGYTTNIMNELSKCDIGVNYSCAEAFGRVTVEYMLAGLTVLASNTGANEELVKDKGIIVPYTDTQALADALIDIISNIDVHRHRKEEISLFARENYCAENNLSAIIDYFKKISENHK